MRRAEEEGDEPFSHSGENNKRNEAKGREKKENRGRPPAISLRCGADP